MPAHARRAPQRQPVHFFFTSSRSPGAPPAAQAGRGQQGALRRDQLAVSSCAASWHTGAGWPAAAAQSQRPQQQAPPLKAGPTDVVAGGLVVLLVGAVAHRERLGPPTPAVDSLWGISENGRRWRHAQEGGWGSKAAEAEGGSTPERQAARSRPRPALAFLSTAEASTKSTTCRHVGRRPRPLHKERATNM